MDRTSLDYILLWDVSDNTPTQIGINALYQASKWPGFPSNPISPNPIPVNMGKYMPEAMPIPSLGERKTKRGHGYASLTNYNNIP